MAKVLLPSSYGTTTTTTPCMKIVLPHLPRTTEELPLWYPRLRSTTFLVLAIRASNPAQDLPSASRKAGSAVPVPIYRHGLVQFTRIDGRRCRNIAHTVIRPFQPFEAVAIPPRLRKEHCTMERNRPFQPRLPRLSGMIWKR